MPEPIEIRTPFHLDFRGEEPESGDWRAKLIPVINEKAEEEVDPKDSSAQVLASSSDTNQIKLDLKAKTASVAKDSGQLKVTEPGKLTLPPVTSIGKDEPAAKV